jgi:peptidoglycan/LPS O-acetylase OafA/YrhL
MRTAEQPDGRAYGAGTERIEAVQYMRGIAALMVLVAHWANCLNDIKALGQQTKLTLTATNDNGEHFLGALVGAWDGLKAFPFDLNFASGGVMLFFLISGFVIAISIEKQSPVEFLLRRAFRLVPLAACVVVAIVALNAVLAHYRLAEFRAAPLDQILTNMLLVNDWFWHPMIDLGYWTLLVEVKFYILMAGAAALASSKCIGPREILYMVLFAIAVCVPVSSLGSASDMAYLHGLTAQSNGYVFYYYRVLADNMPFVPFMLCGTVLFFWYDGRMDTARMIAYQVFLLNIFAVLFLIKPNGWSGFYYVGDGLRAAVIMIMLVGLMKALRRRKKTFPRSRILGFLGDISYSLYLTHGAFGMVIIGLTYEFTGKANVALAVAAISTLCLSWLLFVAIEKPGIALGRNLARWIDGLGSSQLREFPPLRVPDGLGGASDHGRPQPAGAPVYAAAPAAE